MATSYQAAVELRPADVSPAREAALIAGLRSALPEAATVLAERDDDGLLRITVTLPVIAADASQVQQEAIDVVARAVAQAGLSEQAALLDDVNVRSSS
jgi:hypothetical protein